MYRPARVAVSARLWFAVSKRAASAGSRTKARITRRPAICSRSTRLRPSTRSCITLKSGVILTIRTPMMMPSRMTATRMIQLSPTSSRSAMKTPPTAVSGAETIITAVISTRCCTCWTSLVLRVIRLGAPNRFTWASATASMSPPSCQITAVLPVETPSSMIRAFSVGRNSEAIDWASWSRMTATNAQV